jgi:hypothetical protein
LCCPIEVKGHNGQLNGLTEPTVTLAAMGNSSESVPWDQTSNLGLLSPANPRSLGARVMFTLSTCWECAGQHNKHHLKEGIKIKHGTTIGTSDPS